MSDFGDFSGFLQLVAYADAYGAPHEESDEGVEKRLLAEKDGSAPRSATASDLEQPLKWTDDTAMNLAVGRAILDPDGYTKKTALREYKAALGDPRVSGWGRIVPAAIAAGRGIQGTRRNGALMRTPMVVRSVVDEECVSARVKEDVVLTHDSQICVAASIAYAVFLEAYTWAGSTSSFLSFDRSTKDASDSVDYELIKHIHDSRARLEVMDAVRDAIRWTQSSPRVVLAEIRSVPSLATGDVVATLATSLWLGMRAAIACEVGVPLRETLDLGIAMGGDVDTRLALAAPLAWAYYERNNMAYYKQRSLMPDFSKVERIQEIIELETKLTKKLRGRVRLGGGWT